MRLLIYLILIGVSLNAAQAQDVILKGLVLNDTIDKSALNVVNITLKKGSITNTKGEFTIPVRVNDTINISAVQYESRQFVVNQTMFSRGKISLYLTPKITELDEVYISNIELTGDIFKDVKSTKLEPVVTSATLGLPQNAHPTFTPEERRFYSATGGAGAFGSLLNAISGRTKMLRKHLEVSILQAKVYSVRDTFSDSLYMRELNIPQELIEDFVYYIFEDEKAISKVDQGNLLKLLEYMKDKSKQYVALKVQDGTLSKPIKNE